MDKGMKDKKTEKDVSAQADELLKSYADAWADAYAEEAERLLRDDEQYQNAAAKHGSYRRVSVKKRLLRCAAVLVCAVFIASIAVPIPQAHAWRVWWLDLATGENGQDVDMRADDDYIGEYYVTELPEGFTLESERKEKTQYTVKYTNEVGRCIIFIQSLDKTTNGHNDNEQISYHENMIGEFQVLVGEYNDRTVFEMTTDNTFIFISTDASYEIGAEFIEHLHEIS